MLASRNDGAYVITEPWGVGRRIAVASVAFVGIGFLIFAAAGAGTEGRLSGAGSTLANPILQHVSTAYQGYLVADRVDLARQEGGSNDWTAGTAALDYDPVGSVGGLIRLDDPAVSFAASEVPVSPEDLAERALVQFPLINGAVVPVANIDIGANALILDAEALAGIFSGRITSWTDPAIAALNGGAELPDLPISVRHRSDGSGMTWVFTGYLARSGIWTAGQTANLDWPVGTGAEGNRGVIEAVGATPGAIGYAELGQANRSGLPVAHLLNGAGEIVAPSPQTIRAALGAGSWTTAAGISAATSAAGSGWPMPATVYVVMRRDRPRAQTVRALSFFRYFYAEAPRLADALGYVALSPEVVTKVEAHWADAFNPNS